MANGRGFRNKVTATGGAGITVQSILAGTSGRLWIRGLTVGVSSGTPADLESLLYVDRVTASGTATAVASTNIAPDDLADVGTEQAKLHKEHSVAPTYSSRPFYEAYFNHRVKETVQLAADQYWVIPATAGAGMGNRITSTGTPLAHSMISWTE